MPRILTSPVVGATAQASQQLLVCDETMLREPRLLVPRNVPIGPVKLANTGIASKVVHTILPGRAEYFTKYANGKATLVDVLPIGTKIGLAAKAATSSGDYLQAPPHNLFPFGNDFTIGIYANLVSVSSTSTIFYQDSGDGSVYVYLIANGLRDGTPAAGYFSLRCVSGSSAKTVCSSSAGQIDGNWHILSATVNATDSSVKTHRDGIDCTGNPGYNATVANPSSYPIKTVSNTDPFALIATFAPGLTLTELKTWSADPFSIFAPA